MKRTLAILLLMCLLFPISGALAVEASLNQQMSTRSGPGTKYTEELGTLPASTDVTVIEMVETSGTPWCMVEFYRNGKKYRAYTGKKRLNVYGAIPAGKNDYVEDHMIQGGSAYYGPGDGYAKRSKSVGKNVVVRVYDVDGEWALCDYKEGSKWARGYINVSLLKNTVAGPVRTPAPTPSPTPRPTATPAPKSAFNIIDPINHICIDYYGNEYDYSGHDEQFALLVGSLPVMKYFDGVPCVKRSDIYSGPSAHYWRRYIGGQYAYTGTLDKNLRIYGKENGWMLIRYPSDSNKGFRYGWTTLSAISPSNQARVENVEFLRLPVVTTRTVVATDDPDHSIEYIGTSITEHIRVTALAFLDDNRTWVYCEYKLKDGNRTYDCRGFLPADGLRVE